MDTFTKINTIEIQASEDNLRLQVKILQPNLFEDEEEIRLVLYETLKKSKYINYIHWDDIADKLKITNKDIPFTFNAVNIELESPTFNILKNEQYLKFNGYEPTFKYLFNLSEKVKRKIKWGNDEQSIFLGKNVVFLTIEKKIFKNLNGEYVDDNSEVFLHDDTISKQLNKITNLIEYRTNIAGYLTLNNKNNLSIVSPIHISNDKLNLSLLLTPEIDTDTSFIAFLKIIIEELDLKITLETLKNHNLKLNSEIVKIKEGLKPNLGFSGEIIWSKSVGDITKPGFIEVLKGQEICRYIKYREPVAGFNIFGETIPVEKIEKNIYTKGLNIAEEDLGIETVFKSEINGVLNFKKNQVNVLDLVIINGDVDSHTGSIDIQKPILIKGDIRSGFSVKTSESLQISGSVESNCKIETGKELYIKGGVFENSYVIIRGIGHIGFIQDSHVIAFKDLTVKRYVLNSTLFCKKDLFIFGSGVKNEKNSSLVGGVCNVVGTLNLPSVGSSMSKTFLVMGSDLEAEARYKKMKLAFNILIRNIMKIQTELGITSEPQDLNKFKSLNKSQRESFKSKLLIIKEKSAQLSKLKLACENLAEIINKISTLNSKIIVKGYIRPDLKIQFGKITKQIFEEFKGLKEISLNIDKLNY